METLLIGTVFTLVFGGFGYTYLVERNIQERIKDLPDKEDIQDLRERVNTLYEHLLNKPMPDMPERKVKR
jgi:hypothetical protein